MISLFVLLCLLKSSRPYIKKVITTDITNEEFMFVNSLIIGAASFIYAYIYKKHKLCNITNLSTKQLGCVLLLSTITIATSVLYFVLNDENGVLKNMFIIKGIGIIVAMLIGILFFEERLTIRQKIGVGSICLGLFFIKND